jgi:methyl-accepting chemotaxis protein
MSLPPQPDRDGTPRQGDVLLAEGPRMMVTEVVPVWQRHVEASRIAVESGIGDLLESFAHLCDGVMAASQRGPVAPGQGLHTETSAASEARQEQVLAQLLAAVDITHQRREQLLAQLAESLVQLDAVEADLRSALPTDAPPLQRLDDTRSALALLSQQVAADTRSDHARQDQALAQARQSLAELGLERTDPDIAACALQSLSVRIEKDLERVLLGMQFQDRLDQTLTNVARDMQRFTEWMRSNEHASHADAMRWLAELERSYTMQEQRTRHHGLPNGPSDAGSVEFF